MTTVFFGIADRVYHYDRTLSRQELFGHGFRAGVDLALGTEGRIYVPNRGLEYIPTSTRVTILNMDEDFIGQFSEFGDGDGDLTWPTSVALDSSQNVYISDEWLNRISIFDKDGEFLDKWGVPGSGDGEINGPSGIRFDKEDNLYLVDSCNNRVQVFTKEGKFLDKWGEEGSGEGQFNLPWGLTIDHLGDVYVADWRNDRIQKFTADGQFLAEYGSSGSGVGEFNHPTGLVVDKYGDIYVADQGNERVQVLTAEGRLITIFTGEAGMSKWAQEKMDSNPDMVKQRKLIRDQKQETLLWHPNAVAIDDQGRVIILDRYRNRLQVYQREDY